MNLLKKLSYALQGLHEAIKNDKGTRFQIVFAVVTIPFIILLLHPLYPLEYAILVIGYAFLFITELQNTALETALDKLHPEHHQNIKKSKNIAAGSVLLSACVLVVLVLLLLAERVWF